MVLRQIGKARQQPLEREGIGGADLEPDASILLAQLTRVVSSFMKNSRTTGASAAPAGVSVSDLRWNSCTPQVLPDAAAGG
jgi:hypothetical protein